MCEIPWLYPLTNFDNDRLLFIFFCFMFKRYRGRAPFWYATTLGRWMCPCTTDSSRRRVRPGTMSSRPPSGRRAFAAQRTRCRTRPPIRTGNAGRQRVRTYPPRVERTVCRPRSVSPDGVVVANSDGTRYRLHPLQRVVDQYGTSPRIVLLHEVLPSGPPK